jgi:DNA-binding NarL/FixJ family response regulator
MGGRVEHRRRPVAVVIVERYRIVRAALRALLERAHNTLVVAAAERGPDALAACSVPPDIMLLSVDGVADLDALSASECRAPRPRVIVLGSEQTNGLAKRAAGAGASGFVSKREPADTLLKAIERVHEGEVWFDSATMTMLIAEVAGIPLPEPAGSTERAVASLSDREREIVFGVTAGFKNYELAARCEMSEASVRHALTRIYRVLGVKNRMELARLDCEIGIGTEPRAVSGA